jgi:hypothetical protein
MSKLIGFLFPWRSTFKRLELEKQWWHRLAVVVFFVALVPVLLYSWVLGDDLSSPATTFEPDISYLTGPPPGGEYGTPIPQGAIVGPPAPSSNSPSQEKPQFDMSKARPIQNGSGVTFGPAAKQDTPVDTPKGDIFDQVAPTMQKTIEMPDGKTVTYPGTTPDETIHAEWKHKHSLAEAKAITFGFGWAALATVLFSYLLQAAYRALVYVIYGAKARATPDRPVVG